jgi:hypothetical protein
MSEVLAKQVWLYGWGQRMAKLAPKGHHASWSLVLIGLAIEAEEPSGLVQVNVAELAPRTGLTPKGMEVVLQRLPALSVLDPQGNLERVDPTRVEGCPLPLKMERYFEQQRQQFRRRPPDE